MSEKKVCTSYSSIIPLDMSKYPNLQNTDLFRFLKELPPLDTYGPWVAGGAVWRAVNNEPLINCDIDIFFHTKNQYEEGCRKMNSIPFVNKVISETKNKSNTTYKFHVSKDKSFNKTINVQLIGMTFPDSLTSLLDQFDFPVCQFGYDGKNLYCGAKSLEDLAKKQLSIHCINKPKSMIRHMLKYVNNGFTMPLDQTKYMLEQFLQMDIWKKSADSEYSEYDDRVEKASFGYGQAVQAVARDYGQAVQDVARDEGVVDLDEWQGFGQVENRPADQRRNRGGVLRGRAVAQEANVNEVAARWDAYGYNPNPNPNPNPNNHQGAEAEIPPAAARRYRYRGRAVAQQANVDDVPAGPNNVVPPVHHAYIRAADAIWREVDHGQDQPIREVAPPVVDQVQNRPQNPAGEVNIEEQAMQRQHHQWYPVAADAPAAQAADVPAGDPNVENLDEMLIALEERALDIALEERAFEENPQVNNGNIQNAGNVFFNNPFIR